MSSGTRALALGIASAAIVGLGIYQLDALSELERGVSPICNINAVFDCSAVWTSHFATSIHERTGLPSAALGMLYGGVGFILALLWWRRSKFFSDGSALDAAIKLWAAGGVVACAVFATALLRERKVCITCVATYLLLLAFAFAAFATRPRGFRMSSLVPGGLWALVLFLPMYFVVRNFRPFVIPGLAKEGAARLAPGPPGGDANAIALARNAYAAAEPLDNRAFPARVLQGNAQAPTRFVVFLDVLCPHCRVMDEMFEELLAKAGTKFSLETRYYPLASTCNTSIQGQVGDPVQCLAPRLLICAEGLPGAAKARAAIFAQQSELTSEMAVDAVSKATGRSREALIECAASDRARGELAADVAYAARYRPEGTPMVLMNDRKVTSSPRVLFEMVNGAP